MRCAATISTASRPVSCALSSNRLSAAGVPARPGSTMPSASASKPIVDAVPIVLQCPRLRIIDDSDLMNCSCDSVPARTSSDRRHTSVPQPSAHAAERAGQHRAARNDDGGQVDRRRGHQQRRDRLVATAEQDHAVDRVGSQHLLGRHRGHVAPQHRGRTHERLAERHHRQVQRYAASLVDALLDALGDFVQVRVARREVGRGVGDRDVRPAVEGVRRKTSTHPGAMNVGVAIRTGVPLGTALLNHAATLLRGQGPGNSDGTAPVPRPREDGAVTQPTHRADRFLEPDADPREGGTSLGDERVTLVEILAVPATHAPAEMRGP